MELVKLLSPTDKTRKYSSYLLDILLTDYEELKNYMMKMKEGFKHC